MREHDVTRPADGTVPPGTLDGYRSARARLAAWLAGAPAYPANAADRRTVSVLGLELPVRATVAILTVSILLLLDYHGRVTQLVDALFGPFGSSAADVKRLQSISRVLIEGVIPLL